MTPPTPPRVTLDIEQSGQPWGSIVVELDPQRAPLTAENFLRYVDEGYYDGTIFHRVIATFMIQGGGQTSVNDSKRNGLRPPIQNEAANGLKNVRGAIAMARTGDPHSATSQFFINVVDNDFLNHPGGDGWGYCVFGRITDGLDVVDRIKDMPVRSGGERSQPVEPAVIRAARRLQ
ncbi:MAG: peptidylprolyl isomerase [Phycisphaerae bacterium]